jgi:predicted TIM-barrel fold metal-dependent hydrolase
MEDYRPYLESEHHEAFDEFLVAFDATRGSSRIFPPPDFFDKTQIDPYLRYMVDTDAVDGEFDVQRRLKELGSQGVAVEVLFSNGAPFMGGAAGIPGMRPDIDLQDAGAMAYNRWIADFVSAQPERFIGQAFVSFTDVDAAVRTVEWARDHGLKGILAPGIQPNAVRLHWDPALEPLWSALEDLDMPLNFHGGIGSQFIAPPPGVDVRVAFRFLAEEQSYMARRPLKMMLWSGVFERHPRLKTVWTEQHCEWVPGMLANWDWTWEKDRAFDGKMMTTTPRRPSEYWHQSCWVGMSLASRAEVALRDAIGADKIMFGVDFPHVESTYPKTLGTVQALSEGLSDDELRRFLGMNAAALWNLDLAALAPVVDEVGFTMTELRTPAPESVLSGSDITVYNPDLSRPS